MSYLSYNHVFQAALVALGLSASAALAGPTYTVPIYTQTIDYANPSSLDSIACASYGDIVSCSATLLNVLHGIPYQTDIPTGYAIPTPQGALDKGYIVIDAGGEAALGNSDTIPAGGQVEDGYKANTGGNNYFMTGDTANPDPTGGPMGDTAKSWDIGIEWLIDALTIGGTRRDMIIGFDFNQPQNKAVTSLDVWSLITVRDIDGNQSNKNFELNSNTAGFGTFATAYDFDGNNSTVPKSTDFVRVVAADCVLYSGTTIADIKQIYSGTCDSNGHSGYTEYATSKSTKSTEFINFLPELSANLEDLLSAGYDTISVQLRMGCFGGTGSKNGPALADNIATTNCDGGGYGDVFLMAAGTEDDIIPEPGSLALAGLGFASLAALRRRRQSAT